MGLTEYFPPNPQLVTYFRHFRNGSVEFVNNGKALSFPGIFGGYYTCDDGHLQILFCPTNSYIYDTSWNGTACSHDNLLEIVNDLSYAWYLDSKVIKIKDFS